MVSSVEPEVAAVPMTMAAATPRSNGQSTNGFAKVEQGKSYVLSVNAPSGSGEVELLAADSDTQSEPDMFSLLYTKVENSMQIPFVAVSSWVYVQAGNSSINWLVIPANFSLAVPGVSSGGGESFDPTADQSITGAWTFSNISVPTPTGNGNAVNKGYVDSKFVTTSTSQTITGGKTFADGGTLEVPIPTSQGMAANKQYVDTSVVTGITQLAIKFSSLTKAEYDALETKSNSTIYFLTDQNMWAIGDKELVTSDMPAMYIRTIPLVAESGYATNDAVLPAEAPSGVYEVLIPNFGVQSTYTIVAYNQGSGNNRPDIIKTLEDCNQPLIYNGGSSDFSGWSYENETGGSTIAIPVGANVVRLSCYFQHVIGEATSLIKVSSNNGFTQGNTIGSIVVRQLA